MYFISCMTIISFGILAYASLEYLIFGRKIYAYRNMYAAILSMISSSVSMAKLSTDSDRDDSAISRFAFFSFCIFITFLLINLFISILNETMEAVKSREVGNDSTFDQDMNDHIFYKVRKLFSFMEKRQNDRVGKLYMLIIIQQLIFLHFSIALFLSTLLTNHSKLTFLQYNNFISHALDRRLPQIWGQENCTTYSERKKKRIFWLSKRRIYYKTKFCLDASNLCPLIPTIKFL